MTYEDFDIIIVVLFISFFVMTIIGAITMLNYKMRERFILPFVVIMFGWLMFTIGFAAIFPKAAGLKECRNVVGIQTVQTEYGTSKSIRSERFCRYLEEHGWTVWKFSYVYD